MRSLLSGVISDQIYGYFYQKKLLPEEKKDVGKDVETLMIYSTLLGQ